MFVVFLPAFNFRGNRSPYLWWFYKLLSEFGQDAGFICGAEYFVEPHQLFARGRKEAGSDVAGLYDYRLPDGKTLEKIARADLPADAWLRLESLCPSDPLAAFRTFCLLQDDNLQLAIADAVKRIELDGCVIEAMVTCVNCATLANFCKARKLPLLHLELGPLRSPFYLHTAYFDFSGVNGNTESKARFDTACDAKIIADEWCDVASLRWLFMTERLTAQVQPTTDLGLGLQIEDDSNIICYANGHSSLSLINASRRLLADQRISPPVLVRPHPGSFFSVHNLPNGLLLDRSMTSVDFVHRCKKIHTINSGLSVEAMLLGREVASFGESPFAFCIDPDSCKSKPVALSFFLLNYLVPWNLAFTPQYIRWRLGKPTEESIRQHHLESFMKNKIQLMANHIVELENSLLERDRQIAELRSSFAWRLTYPLRAIQYVLHRLFAPFRQ